MRRRRAVQNPTAGETEGRGVTLQQAGAGTSTPPKETAPAEHLTEAFLPSTSPLEGRVRRTEKEKRKKTRGKKFFPFCQLRKGVSIQHTAPSAVSHRLPHCMATSPFTGLTGSTVNRPALCVPGQAAGIFVCLTV